MSKLFVIDDSTPIDALTPDPRDKGRGLELPEGFAKSYEGVAEPFPRELYIPRSEWQARIQELQERKATFRDLAKRRGIKVKNQQTTNYCTTEDTEVLTERGWVRWPDYNGVDLLGTMNPVTGALEYQAPLATQVFEHDGPMIYSTNKSVDFAVTPDHRMFVRKWDERARKLSDRWTFQRAGDLGWYFGLPHATTGFVGTRLERVAVDGDREYDGWDFFAMVAMVVSDGYAGGTDKTRNWVSFACFREDRLPIVRELAARIGFAEKASTPGVFIRYDAAALANWFRVNAYASPELGSENKRVPDVVKAASASQVAHFLAFYGDQNHDRGNHYFSTSKRAADDLQELFLRVGKRASIWSEDRDGKRAVLDGGKVVTSRKRMYHLHVRQADRLSIDRKQHLETERYKGLVYCATVPNSTLVTRRNDSILISGNCWINAPTFCVELIRAKQGQRHVELSPASAGAQIKNYWNVGGWGREGLEWIVKHGVAPVDLWPANAINRRYRTEQAVAEALKYRVDEWWVLPDRDLDAMVSCVLRGHPVSVGYNWWRHQVTATGILWVDGTVALEIGNSWGEAWGTMGYGMIQGNRMLPDDATAPRTALAA